MFEGLPTWIYDTLLECNILPEFCTLEDIRKNARQIEEISLRARNTFKGSPAMDNNSRSCTYQATTPRNNNIPCNTPTSVARNNPSRPDTKGKSSIRNNGDNRATVGMSNPRPSQRSNYNNNSTHKTGGTHDTSTSHCRTSDITCYKCGGKGHISSDPSCPQYGKPNTNPRFNAQRVIEDEDQQAGHHPQDEDGHELGSQHSNSWGGSQYDPQDEGDNEDELEYQEVIPEGEDDDDASEAEEVRMSSMRTVRIFALHRVTEGELDASQAVEHPSDEQAPTESTDDLDPIDEFHRDDPIVDPAYIEYRDGIIYRREPDQTEEQIDSDLQQAAIGATCMVCH